MSASPLCAACSVEENIEHYLLECSQYTIARQQLKRTLLSIGIQTLTIRILLGGGDYPKWRQHHIMKAVGTYLTSTKRLETL
jgi:hypothetical protein